MINKSISDSHRFAALSPQAAVLFAMLIPHFNSHGKMNGGPGYVKDEVCPLVPYLALENIPKLLQEINDRTNVKWFFVNGRYWIHSLNFKSDHQTLAVDKLGKDELPNYSGTTPELVGHEGEVEVEGEEEVEGEGSGRTAGPSSADDRLSQNDLDPKLKKILSECPHLALISTGASSTFWDQILAMCEPYPQAGPAWLNMKIRGWNQWFEDHKDRKSKTRARLQSRIMKWLIDDLEKLARRK